MYYLLNDKILLILLTVLFLYIFLNMIYYKSNNKKIIIYEHLINILCLIYFISLIYIVLNSRLNIGGTSNFTLFKEILRYKIFSPLFFTNVIGNIILFIPFGFFISYYIKITKLHIILLISVSSSFIIEYIQSSLNRVFDIDDIVLNTIGSIIGFYIYKLISNSIKNKAMFTTIILILTTLTLIVVYKYIKLGVIL